VFEAAVDGFGGAIGGVGVVEVGQDVPGSAFECPAQRGELGQTPRYTRGGQGVDFGFHQGLTHVRVGRAVGVDDVLVDAPGDLERDVLLTGEQVEDPVLLTWREQARAGVQHPAGLVQGIRGTPAPVVEFLPGAPSALIESITGKVYDVEGVHDCPCVGEFFGGCAFEPGESIHRDDLDALAPRIGAGGQPGFEDLLGAARDHVQESGGATAITDGRHIQDDGDEFVAVGGVAPHVFIHANDAHAIEPGRVVDQ